MARRLTANETASWIEQEIADAQRNGCEHAVKTYTRQLEAIRTGQRDEVATAILTPTMTWPRNAKILPFTDYGDLEGDEPQQAFQVSYLLFGRGNGFDVSVFDTLDEAEQAARRWTEDGIKVGSTRVY